MVEGPMIQWRTARVFLMYLMTLLVLVVLMFGTSDVTVSQDVGPALTGGSSGVGSRPAGRPAARPSVNPVLRIPKDSVSVFENDCLCST